MEKFAQMVLSGITAGAVSLMLEAGIAGNAASMTRGSDPEFRPLHGMPVAWPAGASDLPALAEGRARVVLVLLEGCVACSDLLAQIELSQVDAVFVTGTLEYIEHLRQRNPATSFVWVSQEWVWGQLGIPDFPAAIHVTPRGLIAGIGADTRDCTRMVRAVRGAHDTPTPAR